MAEQPDHMDAVASAAAHGSTGAEHASGGLPQFDPTYWAGQVFWLLAIFLVLYFVLSKVLLPKVGGALEAREGKIAGDIAEARRLKDEAEAQAATAAVAATEARSRAQKVAADAKSKAQAEAAAIEKAEDERLNAQLDAAEASINAARGQAMTNVRSIAAETAQAIVEKLTGRPAEAAEIEAASAA